ncbi:MAG: FliM/FliN family flagellar motor switch protein [Pseudomonadota bacterium]|nr:FliM/FliN family flagellar motor switch protein [Pseudomonadota bacterium]
MADAQVLSPDEIDALLGGEAAPATDDAPAAAAKPGGPATERRRRDAPLPESADVLLHASQGRARLPVLELLHEQVARSWRTALREFLPRPPTLSCEGIEPVPAEDMLAGLEPGCVIGIVSAGPLPGVLLALLDGDLAYTLVDCYFGGDGGRPPSHARRELSRTEQRVTDTLLRLLLQALGAVWESVLPVEFALERLETDPALIRAFAPGDTLYAASHRIDVGRGGGLLRVAYPQSLLEPVRSRLGQGQGGGEDQSGWRERLLQEVGRVPVDVRVPLVNLQLSLQQVLALRAGDLIPFDMPATVTLAAGDVPLLSGTFGTRTGNNAIKIVGRASPDPAATEEATT